MINKKIKIAILGFGVVGSGVYSICESQAKLFQKKYGFSIDIVKILERDKNKQKNLKKKIPFTTNIDDIVKNPEIQIIVECLGGEHPALEFISSALQNQKAVVTSNKELISKHKKYLLSLAQKNNVNLLFEASVGGGIPIISALNTGLGANDIKACFGILNGTTNYILTKMEEKKADQKEILLQAQKLGFAEADPTMDINGLDVAYKLSILATQAFHINIDLKDIPFEGIQNITLRDIIYAKEFGYKIKLLASGIKSSKNTYSFHVKPTMIPLTHPLASVQNENNAIYIDGNNVGEVMLYGKGAGSLPTASAIFADIIKISQSINNPIINNYFFNQYRKTNSKEISSEYYLRLLVEDKYGVLSQISNILGKNKISLKKVIQKDIIDEKAEIVIFTHKIQDSNITSALKSLKTLKVVNKICAIFKVGIM